jgi:hypothetical protein
MSERKYCGIKRGKTRGNKDITLQVILKLTRRKFPLDSGIYSPSRAGRS